MADTLTLEVVTPDGVAVRESEVEEIVVRRREARFELGSEIAVYPHHAPLLVRIPVAPVRYRHHGETFVLAVGGGFVEVLDERVQIVTPRVERIAATTPDAVAAAAALCARWGHERAGDRGHLIGYT